MIKLLMPSPRPASKLHLGQERWILNALKVNGLLKRRIKILEITKKISLPRILLLIHRQVGLNPLWHSQERNITIVLAEEYPDDRAKARILLLLASTPLPSGKTRIKIRTRKTYPTLSAIFANKKAIIPTSVRKKSQKTSVSLDHLYVGY